MIRPSAHPCIAPLESGGYVGRGSPLAAIVTDAGPGVSLLTAMRRSPEVSVVIATRDRPQRLAALLESLRVQSLGCEGAFEVIVVDDGSQAPTRAVLERERARGRLGLTVLTRPQSEGPAAARNDGWRRAKASLVAFTDDDCVADPEWLAAGLRAVGAYEGALVQGRTEPNPEELHQRGPFSRTLRVASRGPFYQTCNIFYSRSLLERLHGFDAPSYTRPGGEDTDLAWRAMELGVEPAYAPDAVVFHAVERLGPVGKLRVAARWTEMVHVFARHPQLRRTVLVKRIFWKATHYVLLRALVALFLPRRMRFLRRWLAFPYVRHLVNRGRSEGGGPLAAPYFVLHDLVELYAITRGAIRYRVLVL